MAFKVKNAVDFNPCFVDYVVNFGMTNTEVQWREHLLKNGNLAAPRFAYLVGVLIQRRIFYDSNSIVLLALPINESVG